METQYLQLHNNTAHVREIENNIFRMKSNRTQIPLHVLIFEYTTPRYLNAPSQNFTVLDINKAANLLKEQLYQTIMTEDYQVEFNIGNYANGQAITTGKFNVIPDHNVNITEHAYYAYNFEGEVDMKQFLSNMFYITAYFTYKGDRNPEGRDDDDGLCFWHCLESIIPLPILKYRYGAELKPVRISEIPDIESNLKLKINVISQVKGIKEYKSDKKYLKEIFLKFVKTDKDYHYELISNRKKGDGNSERRLEKEGPIIVYIGNKPNIKYYNGISIEKTNKLPKQCHIIRIQDVEKIYKKPGVPLHFTLEEAWNKYNEACKNIKEWSKGKFNLFRYRNLNSFIRDTFYHSIKELGIQSKMERVELYEFEPLEQSSKGAILTIKSKTETYKHGIQYDMKSSYPYTLMHKLFKFPITAGQFRTQDPKYFDNNIKNKDLRYGLYHCKAIFPKDKSKKSYFVKGSHDWFTHWDLMAGYEQGIRFELINEDNNSLIWLKTQTIDGKSVFRNFIMYFYKPKNDTKCPLVKRILSGLWGALCQAKYERERIKVIDGTINHTIKEGYIFDSVNMVGEDEAEITTQKPSLFFSSYARIKPFLSSYQRYLMYNEVIKPVLDKGIEIIKVKNDSIITDKRIEEYDKNKELIIKYFDYKSIGKMIYEKEYHNFKTPDTIKIDEIKSDF